MNLQVTPASVTVTITVLGFLAKVIHWLVSRELTAMEKAWKEALEHRDEKIKELEGAFKAVKETQAKLFDRYDQSEKELHEFKLYCAERYVAAGALKDIIAPVLTRLDSIERDLRERARA